MMAIEIVLLSYLLITYSLGYYISLNSFEQRDAELYCMNQCNSNLASIHSDKQNEEMIVSINNTLKNIDIKRNNSTLLVYFGLIDNEWSDGSNFDYIYNPPLNNGSGHCLAMDINNNYKWIVIDCKDKYLFACNSCNGILNKYIINNNLLLNRDDQGTHCKDIYKTGLASIHSTEDMMEAVLISNYSTNIDVYIGLNGANLIWDDGTPLHFGQNTLKYPWIEKPDYSLDCVMMDGDNGYKWKSNQCINNIYGLCNAPSLICNDNEWDIIIGDATWRNTPCKVYFGDNDENMAIISGKRWRNNGEYDADNRFILEYTFKLYHMYTSGGSGGIIWHPVTPKICRYYYYIGVYESDSTVFIAQIMNDEMNILQSASLGFTYLTGTFYTLRIEIINGNIMNVLINDDLLLSNITMNLYDASKDIDIGYIGIKNTNSSMIATSLFISGKEIFEIDNNSSLWFTDCIITTTKEPDLNETVYPSIGNVSVFPSYTKIISSTKCQNKKRGIIIISFVYILIDINATKDDIKHVISNMMNMEFIDCIIIDNMLYIDIDESINTAMMNISVCGECMEDDIAMYLIENDLIFNDSIYIINESVSVWIETTDSVWIETTHNDIDIDDVKDDNNNNNSALLDIMGPVLGIGTILICCFCCISCIRIQMASQKGTNNHQRDRSTHSEPVPQIHLSNINSNSTGTTVYGDNFTPRGFPMDKSPRFHQIDVVGKELNVQQNDNIIGNNHNMNNNININNNNKASIPRSAINGGDTNKNITKQQHHKQAEDVINETEDVRLKESEGTKTQTTTTNTGTTNTNTNSSKRSSKTQTNTSKGHEFGGVGTELKKTKTVTATNTSSKRSSKTQTNTTNVTNVTNVSKIYKTVGIGDITINGDHDDTDITPTNVQNEDITFLGRETGESDDPQTGESDDGPYCEWDEKYNQNNISDPNHFGFTAGKQQQWESDNNSQLQIQEIDDSTNNEKYINKQHDDALLLQSWLKFTVGLPQYYDIFILNGYRNLDLMMMINDTKKLTLLGIELKGHQKKILAEIGRLRDQWHHNHSPT